MDSYEYEYDDSTSATNHDHRMERRWKRWNPDFQRHEHDFARILVANGEHVDVCSCGQTRRR